MILYYIIDSHNNIVNNLIPYSYLLLIYRPPFSSRVNKFYSFF